MLLVLIRHGESCGDSHQRVSPPASGFLTAKGCMQQEATAAFFESITFDRVYASSLGRAVQTAQALRSAEARIRITEWLRERGTRPPGIQVNPGESFPATVLRIREGWHAELDSLGIVGDLAAPGVFESAPPSLKLVMVAHGGSLSHLLCLLLGINQQEGYTPISFLNTGMALLRWMPTWGKRGWYPHLWMPPPTKTALELFEQFLHETDSLSQLILQKREG